MLFFLAACDKSNKDTPDNLYPVKFEVDNIQKTTAEMGTSGVITSSTADTALNKLGVLNYIVFDEAGKYVHQIQQLSTDVNFGVFSDQLKVGRYTVVLIGSTGEIMLPGTPITLSVTKLRALGGSGDIFFKKSDVTVSSTGLSQNFLLKRIVGYLELKSTSPIPSNVAKISLSVVNETTSFAFATESVDLTAIEKMTVNKDVTAINRSNYSIGKYIMNDQQPLSVQVMTFDVAGSLLKSKTVTVKIERNEKATMSANMTDLMSAGIGFTLDYAWKVDSTSIPFQLY